MMVAYINFAAYYLFGLPLAIFLGFKANLGPMVILVYIPLQIMLHIYNPFLCLVVTYCSACGYYNLGTIWWHNKWKCFTDLILIDYDFQNQLGH